MIRERSASEKKTMVLFFWRITIVRVASKIITDLTQKAVSRKVVLQARKSSRDNVESYYG